MTAHSLPLPDAGVSAEYNRGYVAGIIAAYRYGHRACCGFGPS